MPRHRELRVCKQVGARLGCRRISECLERLMLPRPALLLPAAPALPGEDLEGVQAKRHPGVAPGAALPAPPWLWERCSVSSQQCCGAQA